MYVEQLFFELLRVAIGNQVCLSQAPSEAEWQELYAMAKKQSLVGICFAAVQKLIINHPSLTENLSESIRLQWMGMAAKIQQRNEMVNRQCVEVQKMLAEAGFQSSILKGQGVASLYGNLSLLRQSGDIDIWVDGGMEKALGWCREKYGKVEFDYINAHVPIYTSILRQAQDRRNSATATEVELHWRAQSLTNLFANKRLQKWLVEHQDEMFNANVNLNANDTITTPSVVFNAFYILLHCYHHMFESGLGLRQLMDYYFVLVAYAERKLPQMNRELDVNALLREFGMMRFAKGVMWIMQEVFGIERECTICEPDEKEGKFLLDEVMKNGNFGHHDERIKKVGSGKMSELWRNVQHNWHLASHYPCEFLWQPIWLFYHFIWKRNLKLKTR